MHSLLLGLVCVTIGFVAEPGGDSAGWPQWRGPHHDGISLETGVAVAWPKEGPPVLWVQEIGQGYSGFIAVGDKVYTQTQTLYEQAVICLDADTGRKVWSHRYGWPYDGGGLYPGPRATPAWYQNRVYYAAPDGVVGCLDATDGTLIWSKNPKQQYHGQGTDFGCAASPMIVSDKLILPVGGRAASVVALDAQTGETVWASGDLAASYCTPVPITFKGRQQVVSLMENSLAAFDLQTGKRLWNLEFSQGYDEHAAAPLYREPHLMIAAPFRSGAKLFHIIGPAKDAAPDAEHQIKTVWEIPKFSNDVASSVLVGDHVYGFDLKDAQSRINRPSRGEFRCIEFETGKINWSTDKVGQANVIVADGKLILFNDNGELILAKTDPQQYTELARTTVFRDEICWTPPALLRGRLYLRTQSRAVCLYLGDKPLATESAAPHKSTASVSNLRPTRRFNTNSLLGSEREFPATTPEWDEFLWWYKWSLAALPLGALVGLILVTAVMSSRWLVGRLRQRPKLIVPLLQVGGNDSESVRWEGEAPAEPKATVRSESAGGPIKASGGRRAKARSWFGGSLSLPANGLLMLNKSDARGMPAMCLSNRVVWRIGFWLTLFVCGVCGSAVLNPRLEYYLFTWPLALWVVFQLTLMTISWCERQPDKRRARWWSRGAGLLLLACSAFYFHVCRTLGLSIEWSYLLGYLPAFPVTALCAWTLTTSHRSWPLTDPLVAAVSFSGYFFACAWFMKWWLVVGS